MMLIAEAGDFQSVRFCSFHDIAPVHVNGDIGIADLLKRRIEMSMLGACLDHFVEFFARKSVVDRDDESPDKFSRHIIEPIKRPGFAPVVWRRIYKGEHVSIKSD